MLVGVVWINGLAISFLGALTGSDNKRTIVNVKQTINNIFLGRNYYVALKKKVG